MDIDTCNLIKCYLDGTMINFAPRPIYLLRIMTTKKVISWYLSVKLWHIFAFTFMRKYNSCIIRKPLARSKSKSCKSV